MKAQTLYGTHNVRHFDVSVLLGNLTIHLSARTIKQEADLLIKEAMFCIAVRLSGEYYVTEFTKSNNKK